MFTYMFLVHMVHQVHFPVKHHLCRMVLQSDFPPCFPEMFCKFSDSGRSNVGSGGCTLLDEECL